MRIKASGRLAGVVVLLSVMSGCFWPAPGAGPDRRSHNSLEDQITPATVADLDVVWEAEVGPYWVGDPVTSTKGVHVVSDGLHSFDTETGDHLWVFQSEWGYVGSVVFAHETAWSTDEDVLWVGYGSDDCYDDLNGIRLVDAATGEAVATPDGGGQVHGVRGDRYLLKTTRICGQSGPLGVRITVGGPAVHQIWRGGIAVLRDDDWPVPPLTLGEDHVYVAGDGLWPPQDETVGEGLTVRAYEIGAEPDECSPSMTTGDLCLAWVTPIVPPATSPVLSSDGTTLFVAAGDEVHALDAATGEVLWTTPVGSTVGATPALADGRLFVLLEDGQLVALDATDGGKVWRAQAGVGTRRKQPAVAGGLVFTATSPLDDSDGSVHAFDVTGCGKKGKKKDGKDGTCDPLWSASTGSGITGAPAVSNGQLYVGTSDGRLVAYGLP